jgi:hypothetical protein
MSNPPIKHVPGCICGDQDVDFVRDPRCLIPIDDLVWTLDNVRRDARKADRSLIEIDVRLRLHEGEWTVLWGDPSFDLDHRGHWGASTLDLTDDGSSYLSEVAGELIAQVEDSIATSED